MKELRRMSYQVFYILTVFLIFLAGYWIVLNSHWHRDFTLNRRYSLSPATKERLSKLKAPVSVIAFYPPATPPARWFQELLKRYRDASPLFNFKIVSLDQHPELADELKVYRIGTVVVSQGSRRVKITKDKIFEPRKDVFHGKILTPVFHGEEVITNAIIQLIGGFGGERVLFLKGHGERSIAVAGPRGLSLLKQVLFYDGLDAASFRLSPSGSIPPDAGLIVIAAPKAKFEEREKKIILNYLKDTGAVLFFANPKGETLPWLTKAYQLEVDGKSLRDQDLSARGNSFEIQPLFGNHISIRPLKRIGLRPLFPGATAIQKLKGDTKGIFLFPLLWSGPRAILGNSRIPLRRALAYAAIRTSERGESKLVVLGDVDFAANFFLRSLGNRDLISNLISWSLKKNRVISIRPKGALKYNIILSKWKMRFLQGGGMYLFPGLWFFIGFVVFMFRRREKESVSGER